MYNHTYILKIIFVFACFGNILGEHWNATSYSENHGLQMGWADRFFFSRYTFTGDERVLDLGYGDGAITSKIASFTKGFVIGMDQSQSMIEHASNTYRKENLQFHKGRVDHLEEYLPYRSCMDLVVSFHCLHWVENHDTVLQGIATVLSENGKAYLRFASDGFDPIQDLADKLMTTPKWNPYFIGFHDPIVRFGKDAYLKKLQDHGFRVVSFEEYFGSDILKNISQVGSHIVSWLPHYHFLPEELRTLFLEELLENYEESYPRNHSGEYELPDSYLEMVIAHSSVNGVERAS